MLSLVKMNQQELFRLSTYTNYPFNAAISASVLAHNGFIYTGSGIDDRVTCFLCKVTKSNWRTDDDVFDVHKSLSPLCDMVQTGDDTNMSVSVFSNAGESALKNNVSNYPINASSNIDTDGATVQNHFQNESFNHGANEETLSEETSISRRIPQSSSLHQNEIPAQNSGTLQTQINVSSLQSDANVNLPGRFATGAPEAYATANTGLAATWPNNSQSSVPKINEPTVAQSGANTGTGTSTPTYSQLGIITERPKRTEYATLLERMKTFLNWPRDHHLKPEDLSASGFYYAGYGDCARCFYCGGGLRNWEDDDDVWVEHARWFPKCAYIRQKTGQIFVDTVQEFNRTFKKITFKMVKDKIGTTSWYFHANKEENPLLRDAAVRSVLEIGYSEKDVLEIADKIKSKDSLLSSDILLAAMVNERKQKQTGPKVNFKGNLPSSGHLQEEIIKQMKEKNSQLRQQTSCKVCMDKEVEIVFLPCGHLVCCSECAGAMKDCPVCRNHVKGMVRTFLC